MVTVAVRAADGVVRVEVTDRGGPGGGSCGPLMVTRKVAGGLGRWLGWPPGGGGGGAAGGRLRGSYSRPSCIKCNMGFDDLGEIVPGGEGAEGGAGYWC